MSRPIANGGDRTPQSMGSMRTGVVQIPSPEFMSPLGGGTTNGIAIPSTAETSVQTSTNSNDAMTVGATSHLVTHVPPTTTTARFLINNSAIPAKRPIRKRRRHRATSMTVTNNYHTRRPSVPAATRNGGGRASVNLDGFRQALRQSKGDLIPTKTEPFVPTQSLAAGKVRYGAGQKATWLAAQDHSGKKRVTIAVEGSNGFTAQSATGPDNSVQTPADTGRLRRRKGTPFPKKQPPLGTTEAAFSPDPSPFQHTTPTKRPNETLPTWLGVVDDGTDRVSVPSTGQQTTADSSYPLFYEPKHRDAGATGIELNKATRPTFPAAKTTGSGSKSKSKTASTGGAFASGEEAKPSVPPRVPKKSKHEWGAHMFKKDCWKCSVCLAQNDNSLSICPACENPKPGSDAAIVPAGQAASLPSTGATGNAGGSFLLKSSSNVDSKTASSSGSSTPFRFGVTPAPNKKSDKAPSFGVKFGTDSSKKSSSTGSDTTDERTNSTRNVEFRNFVRFRIRNYGASQEVGNDTIPSSSSSRDEEGLWIPRPIARSGIEAFGTKCKALLFIWSGKSFYWCFV